MYADSGDIELPIQNSEEPIPFEDIKTVNSDRDYGWIYTTVTLPDGRKIEAKKEYTRIKP